MFSLALIIWITGVLSFFIDLVTAVETPLSYIVFYSPCIENTRLSQAKPAAFHIPAYNLQWLSNLQSHDERSYNHLGMKKCGYFVILLLSKC